MAVSTFTAVADTILLANGGSFSGSRSATTGTVFPSDPTASVGYPGGGATNINRLALAFDTSSLPSDAVLVAASLWVYPTAHTAAHALSVVPLTPDAGYPFAAGDFDSFTLGSTEYGQRSFTVGAVGSDYRITLDTAAVTKAGTTYLGLISGGDQSNTEADAKLSTIRTVDYGGGSTFWPRLEVTWFPATQTVSPTLAGQAGGVLSSASSESVTVGPTLAGQAGGVLTPAASNAGGDVFATLLGVASGVLPPAILVGGVATMRPGLVGAESGVLGGTAGPRPRLLGPFSVLVEAPLREGDQVTVTALLRRLGDEPIPLGDAVGVDLYATDQDANVVANWGECTVVTAGDGRVSYVFQVDDLEGATSIDVVWRIRWQGGQSLVPTSPLNLPVA